MSKGLMFQVVPTGVTTTKYCWLGDKGAFNLIAIVWFAHLIVSLETTDEAIFTQLGDQLSAVCTDTSIEATWFGTSAFFEITTCFKDEPQALNHHQADLILVVVGVVLAPPHDGADDHHAEKSLAVVDPTQVDAVVGASVSVATKTMIFIKEYENNTNNNHKILYLIPFFQLSAKDSFAQANTSINQETIKLTVTIVPIK